MLNQRLYSARRNIETLKHDQKELQSKLNSVEAESERLLHQRRKLENENQSLKNQNRNLQNSLDSCQETGQIFLHSRSV